MRGGRRAMKLRHALQDERRYLHAIDKLHTKHAATNRLHVVHQEGVSVASFSRDRKRLSRTLARTVGRGKYSLEPAQTRWIKIGNKRRMLYDFRLTDLIVHGVVASIVADQCLPRVSPCLYSYVKGRSWWTSVSDFARYVRRHCKKRPDVRTRGLYVLRRDVKSYGDTIPLGETSPVWAQLNDVLYNAAETSQNDRHWSLVQQVVRPERITKQGGVATNIVGIPTGSPISPPLGNLYLMDLDTQLEQIPGSFYARYCDDFLFAHHDPEVVQGVDQQIDQILHQKGLSANKSKDGTLFFNGAGRGSQLWANAQGTQSVPFLGCHISFDATVSLSGKKVQILLHDLSQRVGRTLEAVGGPDVNEVGTTVCAAINQALNPRCGFCVAAAPLLRSVITDRRQLKELDYLIARIVLRKVTGDGRVKAFRQIPYRTIRRDWHLRSLLHTRNTVGRCRRRAS